MMTRKEYSKSKEIGAVLAEIALGLPILIVLTFATIDFYRYNEQKIRMVSVARDIGEIAKRTCIDAVDKQTCVENILERFETYMLNSIGKNKMIVSFFSEDTYSHHSYSPGGSMSHPIGNSLSDNYNQDVQDPLLDGVGTVSYGGGSPVWTPSLNNVILLGRTFSEGQDFTFSSEFSPGPKSQFKAPLNDNFQVICIVEFRSKFEPLFASIFGTDNDITLKTTLFF
jgi:hypothetical protein